MRKTEQDKVELLLDAGEYLINGRLYLFHMNRAVCVGKLDEVFEVIKTSEGISYLQIFFND